MDVKYLEITKKELFYTAVMLRIKQLVNIVYDFPADDTLFEWELNEAKRSLVQKKLLKENARSGMNLDFALITCASFCANPESCEEIDDENYHAAIYKIAKAYMLVEHRSEDDLAVVWFADETVMARYIAYMIKKGSEEHGGA